MINVDNNDDQTPAPRRLCSEIQLFDLCELTRCDFKDGKFCTEPNLLRKFEAISDDEEERRSPARRSGAADDDEEAWEDDHGDGNDEDDGDYSVFDDEDGEEREAW